MIVFGEAPVGETRERPGAYAVIVDDRWRVAVVRVGAEVFLPGGGIEPGETAEEAMRREVREETGLEVDGISPLGHAADWGRPGSRVKRIASFFVCRPAAVGTPTEPDHLLEWLAGSKALAALTLPSDQWVTRRALGPC